MRKFKNFIHYFEAYYWAWKCGWPGKKLYVIGVTGTDGKTTTCTLIYEILKAAGIKTGLLTTVTATGLHTTNPHPSHLQPLLAKMVKDGLTHCVLEVTSHGLDQNRVAGIDFKIGVLTNITHEHLDYHGSMEKYFEAKTKLFKHVKYAVLNADGVSIKINSDVQIINYSKTKIKNISPALAGDYNKYNIGAAEAVAKILGIEKGVALVVRSFGGVPGRRQEVKNDKGIKVYVDFAHTPNALEQILIQLRKECKEKLIVVFGCTGERDKEKRPMMGEIAARIADVVIITSDDTRSEDQNEIAKQILRGIPKLFTSPLTPLHYYGEGNKKGEVERLYVINDRYQAIKKAMEIANKGDIVLIAGKGHENTILHGKTEYPWSDMDVASELISKVIGKY